MQIVCIDVPTDTQNDFFFVFALSSNQLLNHFLILLIFHTLIFPFTFAEKLCKISYFIPSRAWSVKQVSGEDELLMHCCVQLRLMASSINDQQSRTLGGCFGKRSRWRQETDSWWRWLVFGIVRKINTIFNVFLLLIYFVKYPFTQALMPSFILLCL